MVEDDSFQCPHCHSALSVTEELFGTTQSCPICAEVFEIPGRTLLPEPPIAPTGVLDWIENLLSRMVRGIFKFTFGVLPPKLWRFFRDTFPWLERIVRLGFLFLFWVFLVCWPLVLVFVMPKRWPEITRHQPFRFIEAFESLCAFAAYLWVAVALLGSAWGIFHITIRRRKAAKTKALER
jgi:hypothetical protein